MIRKSGQWVMRKESDPSRSTTTTMKDEVDQDIRAGPNDCFYYDGAYDNEAINNCCGAYYEWLGKRENKETIENDHGSGNSEVEMVMEIDPLADFQSPNPVCFDEFFSPDVCC